MQSKKIPSLFRENVLALIDSNLTDEQIKRQLKYMVDATVDNQYVSKIDTLQYPPGVRSVQ